uniref:MYCB2 n=1 Tax=Mesocestoides corti TaxID=53468 RepID=A0A5K3EQC7_MESCO
LWRRFRAQTCCTTWPQPIPCLSAIEWHAGKKGSQPEKDMTEGSGILLWRRVRAQTHWITWPQPILCLSAFQWHARMMSSQPEKDTIEVQYIMGGVASVVGSDGERLTCVSGL